MRYAGTVLLMIATGLILAAGCTVQVPMEARDSGLTRQNNTDNTAAWNNPSSLAKTWYIRSIVINHVPVKPLPLTGITIQFDANGSFSGYDSCNPYSGTWQADGRHISIMGLSGEGISCEVPPGVMEQEDQYFAILRNASDYIINGEDMAISDGSGKNRLIYKQVFF
jgi:heat shock protein HslJ